MILIELKKIKMEIQNEKSSLETSSAEKSTVKKARVLISPGVHRSVLENQSFIVEGKVVIELLELFNQFDDTGKQICAILSRYKGIGDQHYVVSKCIVNGEIKKELTEANMSENELDEFKKEWIFVQKWRMFRNSLYEHIFSDV